MKKISIALLISLFAFVGFAQQKKAPKGEMPPPPPQGEMAKEGAPACEKGEMPPPKGEKGKKGKKGEKGDKKGDRPPPKGEKGEMPPPQAK